MTLAFGLYRGGNRYELVFEAFSDRIEAPRNNRGEALSGYVQPYAQRLQHHALRAPYNWFNFYDFWHSDDAMAAPDAHVPAYLAIPATLLAALAGSLHAAPPEGRPRRRRVPTPTGSWRSWRSRRRCARRSSSCADSKLLKKPLRLQGEYQRPDEATLVREVTAPIPEKTTIRAGEVEIAAPARRRAGSRSRACRNWPGCRRASARCWPATGAAGTALPTGHAGHAASLDDDAAARDAGLAKKLQAITLYGRGSELRCIETQPSRGETQRTLLAGAASAADGVNAAGALATLCYGGSKAQ